MNILELFEQNHLQELSEKDEKMAGIIGKLGPLQMEADTSFFESVIHQLFKQQISTALAEKIWIDFRSHFKEITPEVFAGYSLEDLKGFGISRRRLQWILEIARILVANPEFEEELWKLDTPSYFRQMIALPGVGVWTAEMIGIFYFQRRDIFSYGDVGIRRGISAIYGLTNEPTKTEFEYYRSLFSPHLSLASIYIWKVYEGFIPEIYQPTKKIRMSDL